MLPSGRLHRAHRNEPNVGSLAPPFPHTQMQKINEHVQIHEHTGHKEHRVMLLTMDKQQVTEQRSFAMWQCEARNAATSLIFVFNMPGCSA